MYTFGNLKCFDWFNTHICLYTNKIMYSRTEQYPLGCIARITFVYLDNPRGLTLYNFDNVVNGDRSR